MCLAQKSLSIAIIGAGPVGLAFAILTAQKLPKAKITIYDERVLDKEAHSDPRVLALSYGSIELLQRVGVWQAIKAQAISQVHVSQQQPSLIAPHQQVLITAKQMCVPMLGAVTSYGCVLAALQEKWLNLTKKYPQRLQSSFENKVNALKQTQEGVIEVDANTSTCYDLVVAAQGGIFSNQSGKSLVSQYEQRAWIGKVKLQNAMQGSAYERFTNKGPAALLPLGTHEAALVWCQPIAHDDVADLTVAQRLAVLNTVFPQAVGAITEISELESFELGLNAEKTLVQGRMVRVGNAAQTLHPVAGQGLNLGLRDVYVLAEQLSQHADIDKALKKMAFNRAPDRWSIMGVTELLARGFVWDFPFMPEVRGVALGAFQKIKPLKHLLARRMMYGWR